MNTMYTDADLDALLRDAMQHYALVLEARKQKSDNPMILDLIEALLPAGPDGMPRPRAIEIVERSRRAKNMPMPIKFEESVQSTFNQHCFESEVFKKRGSGDGAIFHTRRVGKYAYWSVNREQARAWLTKHDKSSFPRLN
jgi:hypothetical protein